jgi:hypothetical protein
MEQLSFLIQQILLWERSQISRQVNYKHLIKLIDYFVKQS